MSSTLRRRRRRRRVGLALGAAGVLLVGFVVASSALFVWPAYDGLRPAGAIVSLNGLDENLREQYTLSLVARHLAPTLLFSVSSSGTACPKPAGVKVVCFVAHPGRTVGEVDFAASYAGRHGIKRLIFVAGHAQATRARLLAQRCFAGTSIVVGAPIPKRHVPYEIAYEWGALVKATVVDPGCA